MTIKLVHKFCMCDRQDAYLALHNVNDPNSILPLSKLAIHVDQCVVGHDVGAALSLSHTLVDVERHCWLAWKGWNGRGMHCLFVQVCLSTNILIITTGVAEILALFCTSFSPHSITTRFSHRRLLSLILRYSKVTSLWARRSGSGSTQSVHACSRLCLLCKDGSSTGPLAMTAQAALMIVQAVCDLRYANKHQG